MVHRLAKLSKSFVCLSVRLFNKLPEEIKFLNDHKFRGAVKMYLVDKSFYSVDEMLEWTIYIHFSIELTIINIVCCLNIKHVI